MEKQLDQQSPVIKLKPTMRARLWKQLLVLLRTPTSLIGIIILVFWIVMAIIGPSIAPWGINEIDSGQVWKAASSNHLMGTDNLGRDIFSRLIVGARLMVVLPTMSVASAVVVGVSIGLLSGYRGGWVDEVIMRTMDVMMAFPVLMLYMMIIVAVGASAVNVVFAITLATSPAVARLVRGLVLDLRSREFVAAAKMRGEPTWHILFREILPNVFNPVLVDALVRIGYAAFAVSALGFLGLGVPPPEPDWGRMVSEARTALIITPTAPLFPALAIASLVIAYNLLADGLAEASERG
jgi:peptide/nickel transport system permease protein